MGITVRELNGWTPATITRDADGNVTSVSVTEPRFTRAEKALLLVARRRALEPRGPHGVRLSEATDPANDPTSWDATGKFVVPLPKVDFAAEALKAAQAKWPEDDKRTLLWSVGLEPSTAIAEGIAPGSGTLAVDELDRR